MSREQIISWALQLVAAGGGGALVAFGLFRFLGKSWIDNHFAKDLERARSEISLLASRRMKLHDMEYVVFPEVWSRLIKASSSLSRAVISFREVPNLGRMTEEELNDWIDHSDLSKGEKAYLLKEKDKFRAYNKILDLRDLRDANNDFVEFHEYLQANRIFLSPDVKGKFDEIDDFMRQSWVAKKMVFDDYDADGKFLKEAWDTYDKKIVPLKNEIESLVQAKLFPESHA